MIQLLNMIDWQLNIFLFVKVNIQSLNPLHTNVKTLNWRLLQVVLCGQSEVVENIIKRGGQVNFKESEIEYTPMHLAAAKGKINQS